MLQQEVRQTTAQEIGDTVGVSPATVRNRIDQLETDGIIKGYHPEIDYEAAKLPLQVLFVCTVSPIERSNLAEKIPEVKVVVDLRETMTGRRNIHIDVVATSTGDITRITDTIHDIGLSIESSELLKQRKTRPFNHFQFTPTDDDFAVGKSSSHSSITKSAIPVRYSTVSISQGTKTGLYGRKKIWNPQTDGYGMSVVQVSRDPSNSYERQSCRPHTIRWTGADL